MPKKDQDNSKNEKYADKIRMQIFFSIALIVSLTSLVVLQGIDLGLIPYSETQSVLDSISKIFISFLFIMGSIIFIILFGILVRFMFESINQVIIFPFDSSDTNIDGNAIADILITELKRISIIHDKEFELSSSDRLPLTPYDAHTDIVLAKEIDNLLEGSRFITGSLKGVGNLGIGSFMLPLGHILTAIYMIRPVGEKGCIIRSSVHKNGDEIYIVSHANKNRYSFIREIKGKSKFDELVRDLAFKISHKFARIAYNEYQGDFNKNKNSYKAPVNNENSRNEVAKELKGVIDAKEPKKIPQKATHEINVLNEKFIKLNDYLINNDIECPASDKYFFGINDLHKPDEFLEAIKNNNDYISNIFKNRLNLNISNNLPIEKINIIKKLNEFIRDDSCENLLREILASKELNGKMSIETKEVKKKCESRGSKKRGKCFHLKRLLLEDIYPRHLKCIITRSWEDLKYITEAKDNYNQYIVTKNREFLDKAKICCNKVNTDKSFGILFSLIYNLGIAYFDVGDNENAAELFSKASNLNPSANAYTGEGFALRYQSRFKEAKDSFKMAIYFDPETASPWCLLGIIYLGLGAYAYDLYDMSIACLSEAIKRDQNFPYPWLFLCINYSRKAALQKDEETRGFYIEIALECIEKANGYARLFGYKDIPTIATAKAACLLQRGNNDDIKIANNILLYNYSRQKDSFNKACLLYLLDRKNEAQNFIEDALNKKSISCGFAEILFDPDIYEDKSSISDEDKSDPTNLFRSQKTCKRFNDIEKILAKYQDDTTIRDNVRDILSEESEYVRASFEAVSGKRKDAIELLKEVKDNPDRFETDPHFKSIHDFAIVITPPKPETVRIGSMIEIDIEVFNTMSQPLTNITVQAKLIGLSPYSILKFSKEIESIKQRFEFEKVTFKPYVDEFAHNDIVIEVEVSGQKGQEKNAKPLRKEDKTTIKLIRNKASSRRKGQCSGVRQV